MKCSNCGSEDLMETSFPMDFVFTEGGVRQVNFKTYICIHCGHYEFFSKEVADRLKNAFNYVKGLCEEETKVTNEIFDISKDYERKLSELNSIKESLMKDASNLDITVREKNELDNKILSLNEEISIINKEFNEKLNKLNNKLSDIKVKIEKGKKPSISNLYKGNYF